MFCTNRFNKIITVSGLNIKFGWIICIQSFNFQAASCPSDSLALVFGTRSRKNAKKASDSQSENVFSTIKIQMKGWVVVDIKEVFDVKIKAFKQAEMREFLNSREGAWLGFMRTRCPIVNVSRFHDGFPIMLMQEKLAVGYPSFPSGSTAFGSFGVGVNELA